MKKVTIWHNPRCSKSRETLKLLQSRDIEPDVIEYLKTPPSVVQIEHALQSLRLEPRDLMRKDEPEYRSAGLDDPGLTRESLIQAMHDHPVLIQRPLVFVGDQARIGRPPESVLEMIDG